MFITDKDLKERSVIKSLFPQANLIICLFHTLRTFNREITCDKMGITPDERDFSKKKIEEMCYSKSEEEYNTLYCHLTSQAPHQIIDYFNKNWHNIREQWVIGMTYNTGNFFNTTNNRLESFNGKLKSVIPTFSNLEEFFKKLFIILKCVRTERDNTAIKIVQKYPTIGFEDIDLQNYYKYLTPYSFEFLKKQIVANNTTSLGNTTISSCSCSFFLSMRLSCRHIFHKRREENDSLYCKELCDIRWTRNYYLNHQSVFKENVFINNADIGRNNDVPVTSVINKSDKVLSSHEKFRTASICCTKLAEILSMCSTFHFKKRMEQLNYIIDHWSNRSELSISELDEGHKTGI